MTLTEAMQLATDNILSQLRDLDEQAKKKFGKQSKNLCIAQFNLLHFRMKLLEDNHVSTRG